ncbi:hypothetical protein C8F01DRAFT_771255 [Mycena amicta]|nr:hypothetical protein C8F01DRAFT_771255 [Mycena amicta]
MSLSTICANCGLSTSHPVSSFADTERHLLRSRLSQLASLIDTLTEEQQRLQLASDAIVYPVLSLPPEITTEIFKFCLESPTSLSRHKAPLLLTQVCQAWRELVIGTPELWQSAQFTISHRVEFIEAWMSRTGLAPVDFTLSTNDVTYSDGPVVCAVQHAHHWGSVDLRIPLTSFQVLDLHERSLPLLRSLSLEISNYAGSSPNGPECLVIRDAPLLREVQIRTTPQFHVQAPWARLTVLGLGHSINLTECLEIVAQCTQLRELTADTDGSESTNHVTHQSLEALSCNMANVLQCLTLPALKRLTFTGHPVPADADTLGNFFGRSGCTPSFISFPLNDSDHDTTIRCLRTFPDSVTSADLSWHPRGGEDFSLLSLDGILPRVTTLSLRGGRIKLGHYPSLIEALRFRRQTSRTVRLECLTLAVRLYSALYHPEFMPDPATLSALRALAQDGFKIRFTMSGRSMFTSHVVLDTFD